MRELNKVQAPRLKDAPATHQVPEHTLHANVEEALGAVVDVTAGQTQVTPRVEVVKVGAELPQAKYLVFCGELLEKAVVEGTLEALGEGNSVGKEIGD